MNGSGPLAHSQCGITERSSFSDVLNIEGSKEREASQDGPPLIAPVLTERPGNCISRNASQSYDPLRAVLEQPSMITSRRVSAPAVLSPSRYKNSRHFVSNKVVLELRSKNMQPGRKYSRVSEARDDASIPCQPYFRSRRTSSDSSNPMATRGEEVIHKIDASPFAYSDQCFMTGSRSPASENHTGVSSRKLSNPPTKTVLQFCERGLRRYNASECSSTDSAEGQPQNERPPYTKRFMKNEIASCLAPIGRLREGEHTPGIASGGHENQSRHFVLPPSSLGRCPSSWEPCNPLLNAPKKRKIPTTSSDSNMFDFSCMNLILSSYETTSRHSSKRPICRVLRFAE
ncbi:hypothetical protein GCK32_004706 [Trichostrongylus colubriformis]|uniref:Uncharacterized protein n=1 Tax=Trichostrongylus colubriformis TaxID=6319 RepID=A0AAN8FQR8_TRICO